ATLDRAAVYLTDGTLLRLVLGAPRRHRGGVPRVPPVRAGALARSPGGRPAFSRGAHVNDDAWIAAARARGTSLEWDRGLLAPVRHAAERPALARLADRLRLRRLPEHLRAALALALFRDPRATDRTLLRRLL